MNDGEAYLKKLEKEYKDCRGCHWAEVKTGVSLGGKVQQECKCYLLNKENPELCFYFKSKGDLK